MPCCFAVRLQEIPGRDTLPASHTRPRKTGEWHLVTPRHSTVNVKWIREEKRAWKQIGVKRGLGRAE